MADQELDWTKELADQLDVHWTMQLRPRLEGLTDDEYRWEPVPGAWNVRRGESGGTTIDFEFPEPTPTPVTTIAWRLGHVTVGVFGLRARSHFGWEGGPESYETAVWPWTAAEALAQLDAAYDAWMTGVRRLSIADLTVPCGPSEGPYAEYPMAALVLHISREAIHHGAEIALLRDLYRAR